MQSFHHILLDMCKYLMMQSSIWKMVCTRTYEDSILDILEGSVGRGRGQVSCDSAPPRPSITLEQLLATQNDLMRRLVENDEHHGADTSNLDIKSRILRTRISWQLTHQSLPMRPTPWRQIAGSEPRSPRLGYSIVQSIKILYMQCSNSEA
jgi:hypothetical protein